MSTVARASQDLHVQTLGDLLSDGLFIDGDWIESKDQDPNGEVRLIQLADIGDGAFRDRSARFLTMKTAKELKCTFLERGDVLVARMPEPLGRACLFPGLDQPAVTAVDVCILRPNPNRVRTEWLVKAVNSPGFRSAMQEFVRGTTRQRISRRNLGSLQLVAPLIDEQLATARLVDRLDLSRNGALSHLVASHRAIGRFRQAVLAAACSGRLTADWRDIGLEPSSVALGLRRDAERKRLGKKYREPVLADPANLPDIPDTWCWAALSEMGELGRGKSKHRPRNDPRLYGGKYPFVQTGEIARSGGRVLSHSQTYNEAGLAQSRLWPDRTVCVTIAANIADSALLTYPACFPDSVVGLIADESVAFPEYIELFIRTARRDLEAFAPATAQANINLAILSQVAVALPPISEQHEILRRVDRLYELATRTVERIEGSKAKVDRSFHAVLAKAFRGDLALTGGGRP